MFENNMYTSVFKEKEKSLLSTTLIFFLINPFFSIISLLSNISHVNTSRGRNICYFFVALFMGLIAYTQETKVGDISRVYSGVILFSKDFDNNLSLLLLSRHIVFDGVNYILFKLTSEVRILSLFWITVTYLVLFKAQDRLFNLINIKYNVGRFITIILLCFVLFTQVTEIMKQGVATAITFYSLVLFYSGEKIKCIFIYIVGLAIHLSPLFFLPLFFVNIIPNRVLFVAAFCSFLFREFDLLSFISEKLSGIGDVQSLFFWGELSDTVSKYTVAMESFYKSDTLLFNIIFYHFFLITMVTYLNSRESRLVKICMLFIVILNLNYFNNHNYTRLLCLMFPFYILLFVEITNITNKWKYYILNFLIIGTFLINVRFLFARLVESTYETSFLGGSIINLLIYPSFMYLL